MTREIDIFYTTPLIREMSSRNRDMWIDRSLLGQRMYLAMKQTGSHPFGEQVKAETKPIVNLP